MRSIRTLCSVLVLSLAPWPTSLWAFGLFGLGGGAGTTTPPATAVVVVSPAAGLPFRATPGGTAPRRGDFDPRKDMPDLVRTTTTRDDGRAGWGLAQAVLVHWAETMAYGERSGTEAPDRAPLGTRADRDTLDLLLPRGASSREDFRLASLTSRSQPSPQARFGFQLLAGQWRDDARPPATRTQDLPLRDKMARLREGLRTQGLALFWVNGTQGGQPWGRALLAYRERAGTLRLPSGASVAAVAFDFADTSTNYPGLPATGQPLVDGFEPRDFKLLYIPSKGALHWHGPDMAALNREAGFLAPARLGVAPAYTRGPEPPRPGASRTEPLGDFQWATPSTTTPGRSPTDASLAGERERLRRQQADLVRRTQELETRMKREREALQRQLASDRRKATEDETRRRREFDTRLRQLLTQAQQQDQQRRQQVSQQMQQLQQQVLQERERARQQTLQVQQQIAQERQQQQITQQQAQQRLQAEQQRYQQELQRLQQESQRQQQELQQRFDLERQQQQQQVEAEKQRIQAERQQQEEAARKEAAAREKQAEERLAELARQHEAEKKGLDEERQRLEREKGELEEKLREAPPPRAPGDSDEDGLPPGDSPGAPKAPAPARPAPLPEGAVTALANGKLHEFFASNGPNPWGLPAVLPADQIRNRLVAACNQEAPAGLSCSAHGQLVGPGISISGPPDTNAFSPSALGKVQAELAQLQEAKLRQLKASQTLAVP